MATLQLAILIPVFNDPEGLQHTLRSLREATLPEGSVVIVVDDGSEPALDPALASGLSVSWHRLSNNQGIEHALNHGLRIASGLGVLYIARLDAGDTSAPDRFVRQLQLLEQHPALVLVGTSARLVGPDGSFQYLFAAPAEDATIRRRMHINNCLLHPTVMMRQTAVAATGGYSTDYPAAEDYEFFFRIMALGQVSCLPEALVNKEISDKAISTRKRHQQLLSRLRIQCRFFDWRILQSYGGVGLTLVLLLFPSTLLTRAKRFAKVSRY